MSCWQDENVKWLDTWYQFCLKNITFLNIEIVYNWFPFDLFVGMEGHDPLPIARLLKVPIGNIVC